MLGNRVILRTCLLLLLAGVVFPPAVAGEGSASQAAGPSPVVPLVRVKETALWPVPGYPSSAFLDLSPDAKSTALHVRVDSEFLWMKRRTEFVLQDGRRVGGVYDTLHWVNFSPDSRSLAFAAKSGDRWFMITDGVEVGGGYDRVGRPVFSPDGRSLAFAVGTGQPGQRGTRHFIVRDGIRVSEEYHFVGRPVFSPDGKSLAFAAQVRGKWFVVRDGVKVGGDYDLVSRPVFSPDGRSVGFLAESFAGSVPSMRPLRDRCFLVRDGKRVGEEYERERGEEAVALDGKGVVFSPDGGLIAFVAPSGFKEFIVQDGVRMTKDYDGVSGLAFGPDSRSLAFFARDGAHTVVMRASVQVGGTFRNITSPIVFSPDGKSVAFRAEAGRREFIVRDGIQITPTYDEVSNIVTSADGTKIVFAALKGSNVYRVEVPWVDAGGVFSDEEETP